MKNVNVVFDTNAYRNLTFNLNVEESKERFNEIKLKEEECNITSLLNSVTLMELMTHLADKADASYENCKMATIGAYQHVCEKNN